MLGQFCFDLFEAGFEDDEICYFAGCASDIDRDQIKGAIASTLAKYVIKMPAYGDESSLCLLCYYVESYGINLNNLDFEALGKMAAFVYIHGLSFCQQYEGFSCTMYYIEENYQLSLCHYPPSVSANLLENHIHEIKGLYNLSLYQPYFQQFINQNEAI